MLPDFVRVKRNRLRAFTERVIANMEQFAPVVSQLRTSRQHEGARLRYDDMEGRQNTIDFDKKICSSIEIGADEWAALDEQAYAIKARTLGQELAAQQSRSFFGTVDEVAERAGMKFETGGRPFPEVFLEGCERVQIDFDEHGRPRIPQLVAHPSTLHQFSTEMRAAEGSRDFRRRLREIMTRKWVEWRDREADRKLVD